MNLEEYKVVFAVATAVLILVSVSPAMSVYVSRPNSSNRFSQLWVLGPTHTMDEYPLLVTPNNTEYHIFLGIGNHMHSSSYYLVNVKFRNETQSSPSSLNSTPSALPTLYQYRVFVGNENVWDANFTFSIVNASSAANSITVRSLSINGEDFPVNAVSTWDSQNGGFYYQIFFELWLFNPNTKSFQYENQSVWVWLKITD